MEKSERKYQTYCLIFWNETSYSFINFLILQLLVTHEKTNRKGSIILPTIQKFIKIRI